MGDTDDLMDRAVLFYERQGYDFGLDNLDIIRMLAEFAKSEIARLTPLSDTP